MRSLLHSLLLSWQRKEKVAIVYERHQEDSHHNVQLPHGQCLTVPASIPLSTLHGTCAVQLGPNYYGVLQFLLRPLFAPAVFGNIQCVVHGDSLEVGKACLKREPLNLGVPLYLPRWARYLEWLDVLIAMAIVPRMYKRQSAVYRVGVHLTGCRPACWRACGELGEAWYKANSCRHVLSSSLHSRTHFSGSPSSVVSRYISPRSCLRNCDNALFHLPYSGPRLG